MTRFLFESRKLLGRMTIVCQQCGRTGSIDEQTYAGKRLRLRCPYCSHEFVFTLPENGAGVLEESSQAERTATEPVTSVDQEAAEALILEAKRIARLIISEIKLYNQDKIEKAGSRREILDMLRTDLSRGKQHYNSRIAARLPLGPDYFNETVKEILLAGKS
jgi:DNA-directed RNA polymerase subunit RPC12/RpoP